MSEASWVVWVGSVGATLVVSTGRIFRPLREALARRPSTRWLGALLACSLCLGFWVGVASGWFVGVRSPVELVWCGGTVAVLSYAADLALRRLGAGYD